MKDFKLKASVFILPDNTKAEDLIQYATFKNKKKWKHNKRLFKKFINSCSRYLPRKILNAWLDKLDRDCKKIIQEIKEEEDRRMLDILKRESFVKNY